MDPFDYAFMNFLSSKFCFFSGGTEISWVSLKNISIKNEFWLNQSLMFGRWGWDFPLLGNRSFKINVPFYFSSIIHCRLRWMERKLQSIIVLFVKVSFFFCFTLELFYSQIARAICVMVIVEAMSVQSWFSFYFVLKGVLISTTRLYCIAKPKWCENDHRPFNEAMHDKC